MLTGYLGRFCHSIGPAQQNGSAYYGYCKSTRILLPLDCIFEPKYYTVIINWSLGVSGNHRE